MQYRSLALTSLIAFCPACFSPSASEDPSGSGTDSGGMFESETDAADPPASSSISGAPDSDSDGAESTTGSTSDETGGDTDGDPVDVDTTGDEETTGIEATDGGDDGSTGEACLELGTDENCSFCGDTCAPDATCFPEGCLAAVELGFAEPFDDIGGVSGFLYGFPIEVESDGYLTHFGFVAAGEGAGIQMALYSDLDGEPHTIVAESDLVPDYAEGTYELELPMTELPAGTYWLMATLGYPRRIAADLNGGQVNFPVAGITHEFGQPLPQQLPEPSSFVNFRPNFFVGVLQ